MITEKTWLLNLWVLYTLLRHRYTYPFTSFVQTSLPTPSTFLFTFTLFYSHSCLYKFKYLILKFYPWFSSITFQSTMDESVNIIIYCRVYSLIVIVFRSSIVNNTERYWEKERTTTRVKEGVLSTLRVSLGYSSKIVGLKINSPDSPFTSSLNGSQTFITRISSLGLYRVQVVNKQ